MSTQDSDSERSGSESDWDEEEIIESIPAYRTATPEARVEPPPLVQIFPKDLSERVAEVVGSTFDIRKAKKQYDALSKTKAPSESGHVQLVWYHRSTKEITKLEQNQKQLVETFQNNINQMLERSNLCRVEDKGEAMIDTGAYFKKHTKSPPEKKINQKSPVALSNLVASQDEDGPVEVSLSRKMNFTLLEFEQGKPEEPNTVLYFQVWLDEKEKETKEEDAGGCVHFRVYAFCKAYKSKLRLPGAVFLDAYDSILKTLFDDGQPILIKEKWRFQSELEIVDLNLYAFYNNTIFNPPEIGANRPFDASGKKKKKRTQAQLLLDNPQGGDKSLVKKIDLPRVCFSFNHAVDSGSEPKVDFDGEIYRDLMDWKGKNNTFWEQEFVRDPLIAKRVADGNEKNLFASMLLSISTGDEQKMSSVEVLPIEKAWYWKSLTKIHKRFDARYQEDVLTFVKNKYKQRQGFRNLQQVCEVDLRVKRFLKSVAKGAEFPDLQKHFDDLQKAETGKQDAGDSMKWRLAILSDALYSEAFTQHLFLDMEKNEPLALFLRHGVLDVGLFGVDDDLSNKITASRGWNLQELVKKQGKRKGNMDPEFFMASEAVPVAEMQRILDHRKDKSQMSSRSRDAQLHERTLRSSIR